MSNFTIIEGNIVPRDLEGNCLGQSGYQKGLCASDERIYSGYSFRAEITSQLDYDGTLYFQAISPPITSQIHLRVKIFSSAETLYRVYLEPTILTSGTSVSLRPKNPHYVTIGASVASTYQLWQTPTFSAKGSLLRTQKWGSGLKLGGISDPQEYTILSPEQRLLYEITSKSNDNTVTVEFHVEDHYIPDPS